MASGAQATPATPATPPQPPPGYKLDPETADLSTVPALIRQNIDTSKIQQAVAPTSQEGAPGVRGVEIVAEAVPGKINVYDPSRYTAKVRNHEMAHELQQQQSDGTLKLPKGYALAPFGSRPAHAPEQYPTDDPRNYDYGGEKGLLRARMAGKTAADFNIEQQADIVADYKQKQDGYLAKARAGKLTPADQQAMALTYRTYHPFLQQMASVPRSLADDLPSVRTLLGLGKPQPLAPAPAPPGLPIGVAGLGVAPADPLLGGQSVALPTKPR